MKRLKTLRFGAGRDLPREFQNRLTKIRINLLAATFLPRRTPCCLLRFSRWHNARVILTLPLSEMYATVGSAIACDRLRLYGNNSLCDRLRSSAIIWKPAFSEHGTFLVSRSIERQCVVCCVFYYSHILYSTCGVLQINKLGKKTKETLTGFYK